MKTPSSIPLLTDRDMILASDLELGHSLRESETSGFWICSLSLKQVRIYRKRLLKIKVFLFLSSFVMIIVLNPEAVQHYGTIQLIRDELNQSAGLA